ncbi:MAG: hypothetical protein Q9169_005351 [Polycauliona sp. 2 TL-2023]
MWLINAKTLKLEEVWGETVKSYAILSHRWEEEEVSHQDMHDYAIAVKKKGFTKIAKSCELALKDGFDYMWVDTCCIDKKSSAELSEAINSMFRWYESAGICYAFLSDVDCSREEADETSIHHQIQQSMWFARGWTLQELLAPRNVVFYDSNWISLGTKKSLDRVIEQRTGIDALALDRSCYFTAFSIAQRMSWAAERITTRSEDTAYRLLGLFQVNMPMLYGEGQQAFMRLQEEIIKQSDDHIQRPLQVAETSEESLRQTRVVHHMQ